MQILSSLLRKLWPPSNSRKGLELPFPEWKGRVVDREIVNWKRLGLRPVGIKKVRLDRIVSQVRSEWPLPSNTPVVESPLGSLLKDYHQEGARCLELENLRKSPFFLLWKEIDKVGWRFDWYEYPKKMKKRYSEVDILKKAQNAVEVYESIKAFGYRGAPFSEGLITCLDTPFEKMRFGREIISPEGSYEVWSGHHRVAVLSVLGFQEAEILVLERDPQGILSH